MEEWLHLITKDTVVIIDAMALVIIAIGTAEAFFTGLRAAFPAPAANRRQREVWLRYGRWLVAGLTFQLSADIIGTSIAPSWQEVGQLGVIAVIRTILNFFLERDLAQLATGVPSRAGTDSSGSRGGPMLASADTVRAFYESHPYPAPLRDLDRHRELYRSPDRRRALSLLLWPTEKPRGNRAILVAGCGTSQAATCALREPDARVTAIDISETSLRHTRDLQRKYGLRNLDLHRLAIEQVGELDRTFDQIVCTGVLHHLPDPDTGLRALCNVLMRGGAMHLMVYATYGRAGIYMMQEYCRLLGIGATAEELQDLGTTIGALSSDHSIATVARQARDFRNPDALADALLHPQDRAYTVPQLYSWLERCGLSFGRWFEQAPYLPQCGAMAGMPHVARLVSLSLPLQHAAVELLRGTMTRHNFIAYRDDRLGTSQPITFAGDAWRNYVPLRLPWTLCIRERLPPGSVAVLINRAHTYPDLALPIDAVQERIFAAIDGKRSIGEILRDTAGAGGDEQARRFIEQLWEYDQIVFDATSSH